MPYLSSISDWLKQSDQLIRAYPTTTRITTKYAIAPPSTKSRKRKRTTAAAAATDQATSTDQDTATATAATTTAPRATLVLKTYDPTSGACLKYKTDQAAEANRLVRSLSALGREMAGLDVDVDAVLDASGEQGAMTAVAGVVSAATGVVRDAVAVVKGEGGGGVTVEGQGSKKKKKKGKK